MTRKLSFEIPEMDDERGVSPVIGVILMVAITVILAAVIASFVLGFGNSVSSNANAGVDINTDPGENATVTGTWISQGSAEKVNVTVKVQGGVTTGFTLANVSNTGTLTESGDLGVADTNGTDTQVQIIVTAIKGDTKTVIQNKQKSI
ncbi:type IV pilin [Halobacterium zhouii]|uniref:type IV pilin n=1 Tax=Halobacterium zhouii TaxID=2902624 RepID=UPI001E2902D8|nr:type IV pilin N-terminal domain-containing protein [Halobacterium zhouii]